MSKSNPTTRPDAPNYEVVGNMIHRYEPMTIAEAFGALSERKQPLCGFRDADFQPWVKSRLHYVHPTAAEPFRTKSEKFKQCARITAEDPRKVPEGVPELPEPWLAYLGQGPLWCVGRWIDRQPAIWTCFEQSGWNDASGNGHAGNGTYNHYAVDVRTAFAREHFPEYVEALGYPMEKPKPERIQLTDTQLLDKLADTELRIAGGRQMWNVFTDAGDPQMTLREAIEAWGADE